MFEAQGLVTRSRATRRRAARAAVVLAATLGLLGAGTPRVAAADPRSPVGRWKTIDDATKRPKAIVEIWQRDGKLYGKIVELFRQPGEEQDPRCTKCSGRKKGQRVVGLVILEGLKPDGDEWSGGTILDPENGKTYRCKLRLEGAKLKVRGYIGFSLLGRTQYWLPAG